MNQNIKKLRIIVLCGGTSTEKDVSINSGKSVLYALTDYGYEDVSIFYFNGDNLYKLLQQKPDLVYMALHGKCGEDGCIQGALEAAGIKYTGPGVATSAICMNKILTKKILVASKIPTARFFVVNSKEFSNIKNMVDFILSNTDFPFVVKAPDQGSSIGVYIIRDKNDLLAIIQEAISFNHEILIEEYIDGIEVTLPIIGNDTLYVLPEIEITSKNDFYDYISKYTKGLSNHIIPARISPETREKIIKYGRCVYNVLGCKGLSRIDFIINKNNEPLVLEVNTSPGMTSTSLFPDSASSIGINLGQLVNRIVQLALE